MKNQASLPVGVFDSGLGGLTIVRELRRQLPNESILYFGDLAHLPYGTKSREQIRRFSLDSTSFLLRRRIKALVIACNSSSSAAYEMLRRQHRIPVVDVIRPAVEEAVRTTRTGRIAVIGTQATVESGAYEKALLRRNPELKVLSRACPLFVPIVEEGLTGHRICRQAAEHYLGPLKKAGADTVILGCTHYPLLRTVLARYFGKNTRLIDSAAPCVTRLAETLDDRSLLRGRKMQGGLHIYVTDKPRSFIRLGEKFLRERLSKVTIVR